MKRPLVAGIALASLLAALSATTCIPAPPEPEGSCAPLASDVLDCRAPGYTSDLVDAGLAGYACTGSARPDADATYIEGIPRGLLCADRGPVPGSVDGATGYCCTKERVDCAYDPSSDCDAPSYGYQCWGSNRPEVFNPSLACGNGVREGERSEYYNYCCTNYPGESNCQQTDSVGCPVSMEGFQCEGAGLPKGEDLGPNKSRADYYHPVCSVPEPAPNPAIKMYCCYMPAPVPIGGTCVNHTSVPGCAVGRFGFACYGPDTPEDDYLPMRCDPGFDGESAEGYAATLYCCDFTYQTEADG